VDASQKIEMAAVLKEWSSSTLIDIVPDNKL
jgi:hypothetical protein